MIDRYIKLCDCIYNIKHLDYLRKCTGDDGSHHYCFCLAGMFFHIPYSEKLLLDLTKYLSHFDTTIFNVDEYI